MVIILDKFMKRENKMKIILIVVTLFLGKNFAQNYRLKSCNCINVKSDNCLCMPLDSCDIVTTQKQLVIIERINQCNVNYKCCKMPKKDKITCSTGSENGPISVNEELSKDRLLPDNEHVPLRKGQIPNLVSIVTKCSKGDVLIGLGSLIHPLVVLTTTHNTNKEIIEDCSSDLYVKNGIFGLKNNSKTVMSYNKTSQERLVSEIIRHPSFYKDNFHNDIALVLVKEPFMISNEKFLNIACITNKTAVKGTKCIIPAFSEVTNDLSFFDRIEVPFYSTKDYTSLLFVQVEKKTGMLVTMKEGLL